jgi:hypothetical protein
MSMTEHLFVINGVKISKDSRYESWLSCSLKVETVYLRCRKKENEELTFNGIFNHDFMLYFRVSDPRLT